MYEIHIIIWQSEGIIHFLLKFIYEIWKREDAKEEIIKTNFIFNIKIIATISRICGCHGGSWLGLERQGTQLQGRSKQSVAADLRFAGDPSTDKRPIPISPSLSLDHFPSEACRFQWPSRTVIGPRSSDHSPRPSRKSEESQPFINLRMSHLRPNLRDPPLLDPNSTRRLPESGWGYRKPLRRSQGLPSVFCICSSPFHFQNWIFRALYTYVLVFVYLCLAVWRLRKCRKITKLKFECDAFVYFKLLTVQLSFVQALQYESHMKAKSLILLRSCFRVLKYWLIYWFLLLLIIDDDWRK